MYMVYNYAPEKCVQKKKTCNGRWREKMNKFPLKRKKETTTTN